MSEPESFEQRLARFTWTRDGQPARPRDDAAILRDLNRQVRALRRKTIYPSDLTWPPGRKVYAAIMTKSIGRSYRAGELLLPLQVWLDTPPEWARGADAPPARPARSQGRPASCGCAERDALVEAIGRLAEPGSRARREATKAAKAAERLAQPEPAPFPATTAAGIRPGRARTLR